jgi:hypothetical protein
MDPKKCAFNEGKVGADSGFVQILLFNIPIDLNFFPYGYILLKGG